MIDLHVHSTFSDGTLTPAELVAKARALGLRALALTDHDCTGGLREFAAAGAAADAGPGGLRFTAVPGVEISAEVSPGTMHMLGYHIDPDNGDLEGVLVRIREGRESRNRQILARLAELGMPLEWEEVAAFAGEDVVGRPHFAQALLARGYVSTKQEAFDRYLAKGKPAYMDRLRFSPADSLAAIREAGGVPVLAHPFTLKLEPDALKAAVRELAEAGLAGIEVYYPEHAPDQVRQYRGLAEAFGLVATGGSDYHGANNPDIEMGRGFGSLNVPDDILDALRDRAGRRFP